MIVKATTVRHVAIYAHVCPVLTGGLSSMSICASPYLMGQAVRKVGYLGCGGWVLSVIIGGKGYNCRCDHMVIM